MSQRARRGVRQALGQIRLGARPANSLRNRLLLSAAMPLLLFFLIGGLYLDRELQGYARAGLEERLQNIFYGLLAITDWNPDLGFQVYGSLPEPGLASPASGLAASVVLGNGHVLWKSPTYEVMRPQQREAPPRGQASFQLDLEHGQATYAYTVAWEVLPGESHSLTFYVIGDTARYQEQVRNARFGVVLTILVLGAAMLVFQLLILDRGLSPLRRFEKDLQKLDQGELTGLGEQYPREVQRLADALNGVLESRRAQLERYRNALSDLAHGLKTPLAVLRSELDAGGRPDVLTMRQQCERLGELMEYHLARGQAAGRVSSGERIALAEQVGRLREALLKIYRDRELEIDVDIDTGLRARADRQDLMEVFGNLIENACKWASQRVRVSARAEGSEVLIRVEDDGPGYPEELGGQLLQRGVRADEAVPGHGLGLAIVEDIVRYLGGRCELGSSEQLGGAEVRIWLPN